MTDIIELIDSPVTFVNSDMPEPAAHALGCGQAVVYSRPAPTYGKNNEDAAALFPVNHDSCVLVVADGVGGQADGKDAALTVVEELRRSLKKNPGNGVDLREPILDGIEQANRKIMDSLPGAATTIAITEINKNTVRTFHAGDSEILVSGQRGKIKFQMLPHSPVGYALESGLIDEKEAILHEERYIVSNVLGYKDMHITMGSPFQLDRYDTLLLASDGVFDNLQKDEIIGIIRKGPLLECATTLIEIATQRMNEQVPDQPSKIDDLTFILFRLNK